MTCEVGSRVRDGDVQLPLGRIERERSPNRAASLRKALGVRPSLRARLARAWHRVEPPHGLAVGKPEGPDPPPNAVLATGGADHHEVVVYQRWHRYRFSHIRT